MSTAKAYDFLSIGRSSTRLTGVEMGMVEEKVTVIGELPRVAERGCEER